MDKQSRRDIARAYKERKVPVGIFSLRCARTGETWIGLSRNLDGAANSALLGLRMGSHRNKAMQAAWTAHGGDAFVYALKRSETAHDLLFQACQLAAAFPSRRHGRHRAGGRGPAQQQP